MNDGPTGQGSNLVPAVDLRPLNDEEKNLLVSMGYGDLVRMAEYDPELGGPVPAQLVFDAVQRRGMFQGAGPAADAPARLAVRTPDEVVMEVAGKVEATTRPYLVRAGAAMGLAGDLGAGSLAFAALVAPEVTVPGAIGAGIMLALSADSAQANARALLAGQPQASGLHQSVAAGARALGASPGDAEGCGQVADLARQTAQAWKMAMVFPAGAVPNAGRAAMPGWAQQGLDELAQSRRELGPIPGGGQSDGGVLARLDVGGQSFYGVNAHGQAITLRVSVVTATHAEADAFQQAANAGVQGGTARLFTDAELCGYCGTSGGVRSMAGQIGLQRLEIVTPSGVVPVVP